MKPACVARAAAPSNPTAWWTGEPPAPRAHDLRDPHDAHDPHDARRALRLALMHANGSRIVCLVVPPALISLSRSVLQRLGLREGSQWSLFWVRCF